MFFMLLSCIVVELAAVQEKKFFFEENNTYPVKIGVEITDHVESIQGPHEKLDIYQTAQCGTMLVLDGAIQLTQWDNNAYHEMIAHVPLMTHPNPQRVLIIGGGDGGTLTEVLKHSTVKQVILCDIDEQVVTLSQKYFPEFAASFSDPRVTVIIDDGAEFIKKFSNSFDVIIVDASDPQGPACVLYSVEFYQNLYNSLTDDGIIVAQAESPFFHADLINEWHARNKKMFKHAAFYYTLVPTYPSGVIGFTYCAKTYLPNPSAEHTHALTGLHYYTPEIHQASFVLPHFLEQRLYQKDSHYHVVA